MPVYFVGRGVAIQLITNVDEMLDACDVNIIDAAEIEDYRFQGGIIRFDRGGLTAAGAGVVPGSVLWVFSIAWEEMEEDLLRACHRSWGWCGEFL